MNTLYVVLKSIIEKNWKYYIQDDMCGNIMEFFELLAVGIKFILIVSVSFVG